LLDLVGREVSVTVEAARSAYIFFGSALAVVEKNSALLASLFEGERQVPFKLGLFAKPTGVRMEEAK
jgi:hypothetical protein